MPRATRAAQEAHEAIRPTDLTFTPAAAHAKLGPDESRLYQLIWNRFVACQMSPAEFDATTATISAKTPAGEAVFRAAGRKLVFDGFMKVIGRQQRRSASAGIAARQNAFSRSS